MATYTPRHLLDKRHFSRYHGTMTSNSAIGFSQIPSVSILRQSYPGTRALFFDMDGTLFDTEKYHAQALIEMGAHYNIKSPLSPDAIHALMIGKADYLVYDIIKDWPGFPKQWSARDFVEDKNQRVIKILKSIDKSSFMHPQILPLLQAAKESGWFVALVTSSEKIITGELLKIAGLNSFFDLELTRDDCPRHKPDPWPYLEALRVAGLTPSEAIIFEDSPVGLSAAVASHAHVIKVEWY